MSHRHGRGGGRGTTHYRSNQPHHGGHQSSSNNSNTQQKHGQSNVTNIEILVKGFPENASYKEVRNVRMKSGTEAPKIQGISCFNFHLKSHEMKNILMKLFREQKILCMLTFS